MAFNFVLKWAACVMVCLGSLATVMHWDPLNILLLNAGNVLYTIWGWRIREWNMVVVSIFIMCIYAVGMMVR
jgi:hypothetical protein